LLCLFLNFSSGVGLVERGVDETDAGFEGGGDSGGGGTVNTGGGALRTGGATVGSPFHVPTTSAADPVFLLPYVFLVSAFFTVFKIPLPRLVLIIHYFVKYTRY
jgi:hypothetical protein